MARDRASRPEAKPLRLFAAVEIPEEIRGALADAVTQVRERFPKARWVPIQNQHVTVKFLGSTYPRLVDWVTGSSFKGNGCSVGGPGRLEAKSNTLTVLN